METQVWLDHARMCGYLEDAEYRALDKAWQQIGGMLQRMIQRADTFCSSSAE
ncbi:four helix bundle protein [Longimonas sp.]|uniref:four helix bundle protein n=1 Tax=Longimonas sp. TaxID=2039626 RepID=UPI0039770BFE